MDYEIQKCKICEINKESPVINNPVVNIIKNPYVNDPNNWIITLRRHTSLPLIGEIKCLKHTLKKVFPKNVKVDLYQKEPYDHFHWTVEGIPLNLFKNNEI